MEAIAKWDFVPNGNDLLSFNKGDIIKLLSQEINETNWYHAELNGKEGLVSSNMIEIKPNYWFYGRISRTWAKDALLQSTRSYLVRESPTPGIWFLSYKPNKDKVWHFKIYRNSNEKFTFFTDEKGRRKEFSSLNELCSFVQRHGWYSAPWWNPSLVEENEFKTPKKNPPEWSLNK